MKNLLAIVVLGLALAGCTHSLGYAGKNPGYVRCAGKGSITGTGSFAVGAGAGGAANDNFTLQADCGPGFEFSQGLSPAVPAVK